MNDLISRQAAIDALDGEIEITGRTNAEAVKGYVRLVKDRLERLPSADRPQGEWKGYEIPSECSVCGHHWDEYVFGQDIWHDGSVPNYCPHCGARMKGAEDDNA